MVSSPSPPLLRLTPAPRPQKPASVPVFPSDSTDVVPLLFTLMFLWECALEVNLEDFRTWCTNCRNSYSLTFFHREWKRDPQMQIGNGGVRWPSCMEICLHSSELKIYIQMALLFYLLVPGGGRVPQERWEMKALHLTPFFQVGPYLFCRLIIVCQ